jgi:hypothetical protein
LYDPRASSWSEIGGDRSLAFPNRRERAETRRVREKREVLLAIGFYINSGTPTLSYRHDWARHRRRDRHDVDRHRCVAHGDVVHPGWAVRVPDGVRQLRIPIAKYV